MWSPRQVAHFQCILVESFTAAGIADRIVFFEDVHQIHVYGKCAIP